ncbi:MAG: crotonase/enoyl-CoA hydratase family protein [Sphingomonadaceae bacterium]|uniref:crotonase/enoyl-CoA hydratase family protein n=1 Tax=Thermaurantiacus sp. TaxID=2820283 RepID=UPI00298EDD96|nr:crotonase/enoyl-CoA hydratase family protein [Thermaurantiacus sp.]MCS6987309.1 crotonase/enoyl-CoA hydratase family protein [Sphingomonadaceae bacterium]MDW8414529.1 crotonase/enoyl-CoA hydratase family protein [Thermaurantiacus sp.]
MPAATVVVTREGPVTVVEIDRPSTRNAVDGPTARALYEAFQAFEADPAARVAVLAGRGGTFCAGADLKAVGTAQGNPLEPFAPDRIGPMGPTRLSLSKPVIAAIEGHAVAGGLELALWCDLRVVAEDAVLGVFCRRFGVPLIDGGTVRLARLVGESRAMDLVLTGRPVLAAEALAIGLANRVAPKGQAGAEALRLAQELAQFPQACLKADRAALKGQWGLTEAEAMAREFAGGLAVIATGETAEGARRFAAGQGRHGAFPSAGPPRP